MENISVSRPEKIIGEIKEAPPKSSANSLLKYAGTWAGDELDLRYFLTTLNYHYLNR